MPRSPGGTTLILPRRSARMAGGSMSMADFTSSLKQRFAKAYPDSDADHGSVSGSDASPAADRYD
ncbi:hypothetical protein BC831DRAFT_455167 [Entophlyctis helioformis]|nr:hypothetical protein BC831DRAFT_482686 [Entophlyctis helioformis]KAI8926706.1 hypothetical protein BC831DRAFT_455167 [Entophlyctis helioformis]